METRAKLAKNDTPVPAHEHLWGVVRHSGFRGDENGKHKQLKVSLLREAIKKKYQTLVIVLTWGGGGVVSGAAKPYFKIEVCISDNSFFVLN